MEDKMGLIHEYKIYCSANVFFLKNIRARDFKDAIKIAKSESSATSSDVIKQNGPCKIDFELSRKANENIEEIYSEKHRDHEKINYLDWGSE
jgi:hypothetical protein